MTVSNYWQGKRVLVTGNSGFIGSNLVEVLKEKECALSCPGRSEYDLLEQDQVRRMFSDIRPDVVFHLAGLVGGIWANKQRPGEFGYNNLLMNTMVFHEAWSAGVDKFVTCIGGCSYPHDASSPIGEDQLWNGYPQPESASYSAGKRMSAVLSASYREQYDFNSIVLVPGNVYGPYDNFNLSDAHVIPALIRKVHEAKSRGEDRFESWGSGKPIRDFVYVKDVARALVKSAETYNDSQIINISSGEETTIKELVEMIVRSVGFEGDVVWDGTKPDGQMRKGFDVNRMRTVLDFECQTSLEEGLQHTINWFVENYESARL